MDERIKDFLSNASDSSSKVYHCQFTIDENLRTINIPKGHDILGVKGDKGVHLIKFKIPRYYNGIDLSEFTIGVNYSRNSEETNKEIISLSYIFNSYICFDWWVPSELYEEESTVDLSITFVSEKLDKIFNTTTASLQVLNSITPKS